MPSQADDRAALRRYAVMAASLLFMLIGTGSIYFIVVALKSISAEFDWPRAVPSLAYSLQYFGGVRAYNSMKAALINHVSNVAHQLAPKGIRANTVSPGTVYFKGGVWHDRELQQPEFFQAALKMNPMGRMCTPEEVANATVFLASPAASFISGTNLVVDGALMQGVQY